MPVGFIRHASDSALFRGIVHGRGSTTIPEPQTTPAKGLPVLFSVFKPQGIEERIEHKLGETITPSTTAFCLVTIQITSKAEAATTTLELKVGGRPSIQVFRFDKKAELITQSCTFITLPGESYEVVKLAGEIGSLFEARQILTV
jgi:hypothetical protein